jgi:hypothetical protein
MQGKKEMWGRWLLRISMDERKHNCPSSPYQSRRELFRKQSALIVAQHRYTQSLLYLSENLKNGTFVGRNTHIIRNRDGTTCRGRGGVPTKILITQNRIYFKTIESIVFIQNNLNFVFNK